ncbi:metal dependent phosphohydrolase [Clostridium baratii]|uniref:bis(5'-nucleosyl)-tetraphosphatase (symmetrical) n=1 Tax=Clostridium baratii str. Sullivan TaxID=1415775 RepID=A0A0A7FVN1_9CLOT|nr:bis(5'-nucleosyl)-tetraphosphatase (symmetrical) YqeK [Clostridium baratii]AIY83684.1 HD domain protein [Clostridium baratii str. Sullivan]MDU1052544.1 bis(5'-nucleosyl)-tetraphosphatase (symmetrical) YqeK [Clostridium baratii]CUP34328.1 metal dependent phosphohydrolase [Clostridium baratii]
MKGTNMEITYIYDYLKKNLKEKRYIHVLGVVSTAKKLAKLNGVSEEKAEIAALCHDAGKNLTKEQLLNIIEKNNIQLTLDEKKTPELWHAIVSPIIAKEEFNINDEEILEAARWHTTGRPNMTKLEKIIYISDMIEPSRVFNGVDSIREAVLEDLDLGVLKGMEHTIRYLLDKEQIVDKNTIEARNYLIIEKNNI